jgi:hypothetical protein
MGLEGGRGAGWLHTVVMTRRTRWLWRGLLVVRRR